MKKYIAPAMQTEEAQVVSMLAESLNISDTTVDGSNALTCVGDFYLCYMENFTRYVCNLGVLSLRFRRA